MTDILGLFERAFPALDSASCPTHPTNCPGHWHVEVTNEGTRFSKPMRLTDIAHREVCSGVTQYELTLVEDRFPETGLTPYLADLYSISYPQRWLLGADTPKEALMPYTEDAPFTHTDKDSDVLTVHPDEALMDTAYVVTSGDGVFVSTEDAPAVALAILEAAGHRPSHAWTATSIQSAVFFLKQHASAEAERKAAEEEAAAEAADAAKLDEEAQAIRSAMNDGDDNCRRWSDLSDRMRNEYRAAARKARELHGKA